MSQENVALVRNAFWEGVDVAARFRDEAGWPERRAEFEANYEPDCAFAWIAQGQRAEATGADEARQFWLDFFEPWESVRTEIERIIPVRGDRVVVLTRTRGRMTAVQHEVELLGAAVYLIRSGKLASVEFYANRAEALEAVGLRERPEQNV
jgi:ketosteroid isomerase-like protein